MPGDIPTIRAIIDAHVSAIGDLVHTVTEDPVNVAMATAAYALVAVAIVVGYKFSSFVLSLLWRACRPAKDLRKYGKWAVVTGATDGIGKEMARQMADQGMSIVLISRTQAKLDAVAEEIGASGTAVKTIAVDFANVGADDWTDICDELDKLDIGVLVNNVGMSYRYAEYFNDLSSEEVASMIDLNVNSTTNMTRCVLRGMTKRKRGAIINVGSAAGLISMGNPLYSLYSATKAYVDFFSRSLHYELASKNIHVQCQVPYFVTSKLSKLRHSSLFIPSPKTYARAALRAIGYEPTIVPYWAHAIQNAVVQNLPLFLQKKVVLGHNLGIRKRALKKLRERAAAAKNE
jgi:17beta-estradiol 17-dehydrogenase / very-long-chain 3-oxoacyl-CoA reductase